MNQSIELLRDVVRTARDGDEGIRLVMEKTRDTAFREAPFLIGLDGFRPLELNVFHR